MRLHLDQKRIRLLCLAVLLIAIIGGAWYFQLFWKHTTKPMNLPGSEISFSESMLAVPPALSGDAAAKAREAALERREEKADTYPFAREIVNPADFINAGTTTIASFIGKKVVLLNFWTSSCINCLRTLPYLNAWYSKYKDNGLVILGIHTPEFTFERDYRTVLNATKRFGITYPVVLDNGYSTWSVYGNDYWPRLYLIDIDGSVIYDHVGEGDYPQIERVIQDALKERMHVFGEAKSIDTSLVEPAGAEVGLPQTTSLATYFGSARNSLLGNGEAKTRGDQYLTIPKASEHEQGRFYLDGSWRFEPQYVVSLAPGKIVYPIQAGKVFFVGGSDEGVTIRIVLDGKPLSASMRGSDVGNDSTVTIKEERLYRLIENAGDGPHTLEIHIDQPGLKAYLVTFG
jgi:thiol-disulfide isomerase/thioredoxin